MFQKLLAEYGLYFAWLVSIVATGGSLYFSEVMHFIPCPLCWFQRILMYPLVVILGIASFRNDRKITAYVLPLSLIGLGIAAFHYFLIEQKLLGELESPVCRSGVPCDTKYIEWLGFITIPLMSLVAFSLITSTLLYVRRAARALPELETSEIETIPSESTEEPIFKGPVRLPVIALLLAGAGTLALGFDLSRKYPGESPATWSLERLEETSGALKIDGAIQDGEYQYTLKSSRIKMEIYWSIHGDRIYWGIHAPTQGWIALGLATEIPLMRGADIVIGYIKDDQLTLLDSFGNTRTGHQMDTQLGGRDDILEKFGVQDEQGTTIEFSRALATEDAYDRPIRLGEKMMLLLAYGQQDDVTSYHDRMRALIPRLDLFPKDR